MNEQEKNIIAEFHKIRDDIDAWGAYVDKVLINDVLAGMVKDGFVKIPPAHRVKSDKSYLNKVLYRRYNFRDPLAEVVDKVATRVVLLRSDDVIAATDLICNYKGWQATVTKTLHSQIEDQPNVFDYQSCHIVVRPNDDYHVSVDKNILTCEIQVRTLLQHAFAEVSHDSTYKGPYQHDNDILRALAKSMALMEATDDYFSRIFTLMADEKRKYANYFKQLARLYTEIVPAADKKDFDFDLNDRLFVLLAKKDVAIDELQAFAEKYKKELTRALLPKNGVLLNQPVTILIAYYLFHDKEWLKTEWPINKKRLEELFQAFNISFDNY